MDHMVRFLCFLVLSTVGMGAIGISLLAEPLVSYYADSRIIGAQRRRIEMCRQIQDQQQALLANADNPYVIERLAIDKLNYVPAAATAAQAVPLPDPCPKLEAALSEMDQMEQSWEPGLYEKMAQRLCEKPATKSALMLLGSSLVVISLGFFYRQSSEP